MDGRRVGVDGRVIRRSSQTRTSESRRIECGHVFEGKLACFHGFDNGLATHPLHLRISSTESQWENCEGGRVAARVLFRAHRKREYQVGSPPEAWLVGCLSPLRVSSSFVLVP